MMGTVIASVTTKHIKKSPPLLPCFIASSSLLDGIITLFVLRKRKLAETIQTHCPSQRVDCPLLYGCVLTVIGTYSYQYGEDLKQWWALFLRFPSSLCLWSWRFEAGGKIEAQLHIIITTDKILFSYIYCKHFTAKLLSFLLRGIYHQNAEEKTNSLFYMDLWCRLLGIFPLSISPNLLYRSVGLKVHLFQLANDLFWAVGKYLSQLVLVLKSLRDGAEGSAKSINLSENGDMIYAGSAATPQEQENLAQPWKDEYTLLKIS